jgi:hypothetical protein
MKPIIDGPLPGESWSFAPKTMPWDKPAKYADPQQGLMYLFKQITKPDNTKKFLGMIDAGMPIDMLAEGLLMQGFMEGLYSATALIPMVGPLNVILIRMCETAGVTPRTSQDDKHENSFDPADLMAAERRFSDGTAAKAEDAVGKSTKDVFAKDAMDKQGFMKQRPKLKPGGRLI